MIDVERMSFAFGERVVFDAVSFKLPRRGLVAVVGPNGVGKTTLLRLIGGIYKTQLIFSDSVKATYLDTEFLTLEMLTVREILHLLSAQGESIDREALRNNVLISQPMMSTRISALSLGQRQRLVIVIAEALTTPTFVLLDEPFNGLDLQALPIARQQLSEVSKSRTVLFATHDERDISELASHVLQIVGPTEISLISRDSYMKRLS